MKARCPCAAGIVDHGTEDEPEGGQLFNYGEHSPWLTHIVKTRPIVSARYTLFYACSNHAKHYRMLDWQVVPLVRTRERHDSQ